MKLSNSLAFALVAICGLALANRAAGTTLLDDTWATGNRSTQNLPSQSAWYANSSGNLTAAVGTMTGTDGSGSAEWLTYFTPSTAQNLNVGDTLQVALTMNFVGVNTGGASTSRGVRIGLFDFSGGTRLTGDTYSTGSGSGAPGLNVTGYMLNMNMATTFDINNPLEIMARSTTSDVNLMGSSGDYTTIGSGGGSAGDPGFVDGTSYTLTFAVTRTSASSVDIATSWVGTGLNISTTQSDSTYNYTGFDTFAIRPAGNLSGASTWNFTEMKVDYLAVPEPSTLALAGLGMLGLAAARRFRRS